MLGEGEDRYSDVGKDEIFRHEIQETEKLLGHGPRFGRQVIVGVVRLTDAAEENGDNSGQSENFGDQERRVRHQDEERRLQRRKVSDVSELGQQGGRAT